MKKYFHLFSVILLFSIAFVTFSFAHAEQASGKPAWEVMSYKVCGDMLCSEVEQQMRNTPSIAYFPPPLKQISQGIDLQNITCTEGKELVLIPG